MTPRSLFNIILKVLGIYFIKEFLVLIPQLLSSFLFYTKSNTTTEAVWIFFSTLVMLLIYGLLIVYLVLKTDWVIDKFELDKGFAEETFELKIHRSTVLSISIIVIGALIFITALPYLCRDVYFYFQMKRLAGEVSQDRVGYLLVYLVETITGLLMVSYQRSIVNWIELKRRKN